MIDKPESHDPTDEELQQFLLDKMQSARSNEWIDILAQALRDDKADGWEYANDEAFLEKARKVFVEMKQKLSVGIVHSGDGCDTVADPTTHQAAPCPPERPEGQQQGS